MAKITVLIDWAGSALTPAQRTFRNFWTGNMDRYLNGLEDWDTAPETERESYPKWNGNGHWVSKRRKLSEKTVTFSGTILDVGTEVSQWNHALSQIQDSTSISLRVEKEGFPTEIRYSGHVVDQIDWNQNGQLVKFSIPIIFAADPYRYDVSDSSKKRL